MKWILLLLFPCALFAKLNGNGDFQIWNTESLNVQLSKKSYLKSEVEFRYGNNRRTLYLKHYQGGLLFVRSPYILFEIAYRQTYRKGHKKWHTEYNPIIDLTFQITTRRGLLLSNRNRIQYRIMKSHNNLWLYRNKLEFIPPYRITRSQIAPYIADEFFWEEGRGINQNRIECGLKIPYHQKTQLNLSYMWRSVKQVKQKWVHHNVLRIQFSLHF